MSRSNFIKIQKAYGEETLPIAIADIEAKKLNKHQASVGFSIPYSTFNVRINEKYKRPANVEVIKQSVDWGGSISKWL
ncbi:hypothetical protein BpHYR1_045581 [Brachionus plicatilis]|uniref:Uncharacterized protein n=1 Tax=Brachionus plicatilis TaxID=10195 RepID=A0A3M7QMB4_BRAPC|nr:hypothetical protein BpHYR1_045581 [Brachionus plicatilis]